MSEETDDILAMDDNALLRRSLSWLGLSAPESNEELAFGWERHVRRLLRAVTDQARRASAPPHQTSSGEVRALLEEARDLLMERIYGSPARSPGHNARLKVAAALAALTNPQTTEEACPHSHVKLSKRWVCMKCGDVVPNAASAPQTTGVSGGLEERLAAYERARGVAEFTGTHEAVTAFAEARKALLSAPPPQGLAALREALEEIRDDTFADKVSKERARTALAALSQTGAE